MAVLGGSMTEEAAGVLCWSTAKDWRVGEAEQMREKYKLGLEQMYTQVNTYSLGSYFYAWIVYGYIHIQELPVWAQILLFVPWMQG